MKLKSWAITIAVSLAIFLGLAAVKVSQIQAGIAFAESFPEHSETVESAYPQVQAHTQRVTVLGEVVAPRNVALYSELPGRITQVGFRSGDAVAAGDVLIQQDISEEQALLDAAEARLQLAQSVYRRNEKLYATNAVSEEQFDRARVELATIKAEIARLQSLIRKKTITAPFAGTTGIHQFEVGQFLGNNVLITRLVGDEDMLWIDFHVPQFYPLLHTGDTVEIQLLRSASGGTESPWVVAEVVARSNQVDNQNRSYQYRARVDRTALGAGINSGVSVRLPASETVEASTVPATAIQHDHLGQFVYLLESDAQTGAYRAKRHGVTVISRQDGLAYLAEGPGSKQLVATDGAFKLYPGLLVHSRPPAPSTAQATRSTAGEAGGRS